MDPDPALPVGFRTSDYDYDLPEDRVARYPAVRRDESRLLVVGERGFGHRRFGEVGSLLRPGDVLVVNDTRVFPARLIGSKPTGARAEILLIRPWSGEGAMAREGSGRPGRGSGEESELWEALVRPGGKLKPGRTVDVADDLRVEIVDSVEGGGRLVRLISPLPVAEALARHGHVPLPPYIDRQD